MWISFIITIFLSLIILAQDFKERLINLWVIIGFMACNFIFYLFEHAIFQFLENIIFCLTYFAFSYLVLTLYFYLKNRKFEKLLDVKMGWGDVLVLLAIGATLELPEMIYLFTISFVIAAITGFVIGKKNPFIPLAGISVVIYSIYLVIEKAINYFDLP